MLCRLQPSANDGHNLTVYSNGTWMHKGSHHHALRCMGCSLEFSDNTMFHLVDNHFMCNTCKVQRYFDVTLICDRDVDGDLLPNVEKVPLLLGSIIQHLPTPAQYVQILNCITTHHLCTHPDESECSMGHRGYCDEPQCSNGIRNDLMAEAEEFILYIQLAYLCGGMRTVDKLYLIMRSISNYFDTDFHIFDINSNDPSKKQWASYMINCMNDVITNLTRHGQDVTTWLRTSHLYEESCHDYVQLVRRHLLETFQ